jgi:ribosomal peptide maturation radical SAM protein 1
MYRIALINMPFAAANLPSIALAQLRSVVQRELGDRVHCDVHYMNLDFVGYLGLPLFQAVSLSVQANTSGLGDWFFSQEAFPQLPDRSEAYLNRHFSEQRAELDLMKAPLLAKRRTVGDFLAHLIARYRLTDYQMIAFTSMFSQNVACFAMARALKKRRSDLKIVMGGANCESPMGNVIVERVPEIDFVFSGPALRSFPRLVSHLLAGDEEACHHIGGVLSRPKLAAGGGAAAEIGEELDIDVDVPIDYDDYLAAFDERLRGTALVPKIPFETSRGCWWGERSHCTFCGLNGMTMKYRAMAPAKAIALLQDLFARYGGRATEFQSVDNILPREYLTEVLPHLDPPAHVGLFYEIKADLKEHEVAALKRAHVVHIQPGIEALSTRTLKLMRKGTTSWQNIRFLIHCLRYDIAPYWNLLVGFPNEPEDVYSKYFADLPLLVHLSPPSGVYPVRFDRFSPYYKLAAEYGLKLQASDFYSMVYPFPPEDLARLAYFFKDTDAGAAYIVNTARWLGRLRQRVADWQRRWQDEAAGRPELTLRRGAGGAWTVHDSRAGAAVERRLSDTALRVLAAFADGHKLAWAAARLPDLSPAAIEAEVGELAAQGLLFAEDGTYINLVTRPPAGAIDLPELPLGWAVAEPGAARPAGPAAAAS